MEFGIFDHVDERQQPLAQMFDERIEFIRAAEDSGFRGYHVAEHHCTPLGMAPSPGVWLSAVARETSTIRFGPMVYLLPLYHPLRLIEEICMLDHLSNGRLEVGVGRGVSPVEIGMFGVDPAESPAMYMEALDLIHRGLTVDKLSFEGKYYQYEDVPMSIKPLQKPVPFWSASMSPDGQTLAARHGMHSCALGDLKTVKQATDNYKALWTEHAGDPLRQIDAKHQLLVGAYRQVIIADTDAEAEKLAGPVYRDWFDKLIKLWKERNVDAPFLGSMGEFEVARKAGLVVVGSPNSVADELNRHAQECGFNYLVAQIAFGNLTHAQEMRSLEHFTKTVIPAMN